jgi:hypothetical protein
LLKWRVCKLWWKTLQENLSIPMAILTITHGFTMSTWDLPTDYPRHTSVGYCLVGNSLPKKMPWVTLLTAFPMLLSKTLPWIITQGNSMSRAYPRLLRRKRSKYVPTALP